MLLLQVTSCRLLELILLKLSSHRHSSRNSGIYSLGSKISLQADHLSIASKRNLNVDLAQNDILVIDDVEAQRRLQWLTKLNSLVANETRITRGENKVGFCILKVPKYIRQPCADFTPSGWRFGLHNCENLDTTGSEAVKIMLIKFFGLMREEFGKFCEFVVDDPKNILQCYALQEEEARWTNEVIQKQLALDALFLALYLDPRISTSCWL